MPGTPTRPVLRFDDGGWTEAVGNHPALDLVNTVAWRLDPARTVDRLADGAGPGALGRLHRSAGRRPGRRVHGRAAQRSRSWWPNGRPGAARSGASLPRAPAGGGRRGAGAARRGRAPARVAGCPGTSRGHRRDAARLVDRAALRVRPARRAGPGGVAPPAARGPAPAPAVPGRRLRLAVPRPHQERLPRLVQLRGLREPGPGSAPLPAAYGGGALELAHGLRRGRPRRRRPGRGDLRARRCRSARPPPRRAGGCRHRWRSRRSRSRARPSSPC